jgi:hypothetical protein
MMNISIRRWLRAPAPTIESPLRHDVFARAGCRRPVMRPVRLAMVLAMTTAASLVSFAGVSSTSAAQSTARQPPPPCAVFWRHSGHTDRAQWFHCHATSSPYTKRVHICGYSGVLHGISVASLPDGIWLRARHRHDRGGEGCRRR